MARQKRTPPAFAIALAQGKTVVEAARMADISLRTAFRRMEDPALVAQIDKQRECLTELAVDRLTKALDPLCAQLIKLAHDAKSEYVQLNATRTAIKAAIDLRDRQDLDIRIREIELEFQTAAEVEEQALSEAAEYWPPSLDAGPPRVAGMSRADAIRHNAVWLKYRSNDRGIPEEQKASLQKTADQLLQNAARIDAPDPESQSPYAQAPVRGGSPDPAETPDRRSHSGAQPSPAPGNSSTAPPERPARS